MTVFVNICAIAAICSTVVLMIAKGEKELSLLLSTVIYILVMIYAITRTGAFFDAVKEGIGVVSIPNMDLILKCGGIGIISSITAVICENSGQKGMACAIETLAVIEIIGLCVPLGAELLDFVYKLLGE